MTQLPVPGLPEVPDDRFTWELPAFEVHEFHPRRTAYSLCVFVINEGARILRQLERMQPYMRHVDVILADGGSTDGSMERGRLADAGVRALVVKRGPGRLSAQMRIACAFSIDQGYAGVVTMDGNDKDDPAGTPSFIRALEEGWDHVQGSRFRPG
ncbi:MAG: glycosyltransferase family 2 protein, partial [Acidobacteria bacterium]|nr:glycosyltransferase family 2 protein [Acidobacteriota bacterium]